MCDFLQYLWVFFLIPQNIAFVAMRRKGILFGHSKSVLAGWGSLFWGLFGWACDDPSTRWRGVAANECSRDLSRFAEDRPGYDLAIAVYTGEDNEGYKPCRPQVPEHTITSSPADPPPPRRG